MKRENSFHTDAVGDFAHREGLRVQQPFSSDHRTLKYLNALFFSFNHFHVHADSITDFKTGRRLPSKGLLYPFQPIHETTPSSPHRTGIPRTPSRISSSNNC